MATRIATPMVREKVEPAPRHRWTPKERAEIFTAAKGVCHLCDTKIRGDEPWDAEHPIPHFLGLPERIEDMKPAHKRCNQRKNNEEDTPLAAKTRRQAEKFGPDSERTVSPAWPKSRKASFQAIRVKVGRKGG